MKLVCEYFGFESLHLNDSSDPESIFAQRRFIFGNFSWVADKHQNMAFSSNQDEKFRGNHRRCRTQNQTQKLLIMHSRVFRLHNKMINRANWLQRYKKRHFE